MKNRVSYISLNTVKPLNCGVYYGSGYVKSTTHRNGSKVVPEHLIEITDTRTIINCTQLTKASL